MFQEATLTKPACDLLSILTKNSTLHTNLHRQPLQSHSPWWGKSPKCKLAVPYRALGLLLLKCY